jgi:hypothetical protein
MLLPCRKVHPTAYARVGRLFLEHLRMVMAPDRIAQRGCLRHREHARRGALVRGSDEEPAADRQLVTPGRGFPGAGTRVTGPRTGANGGARRGRTRRIGPMVRVLGAHSGNLISVNRLGIVPSRVPPIVRTWHPAGVVLFEMRPFCSESRALDHVCLKVHVRGPIR